MDIAAMSTILSQNKIKETAGIMILDKVMDTAKQNGDALNQLITDAQVPVYEPHLGKYIDKYA